MLPGHRRVRVVRVEQGTVRGVRVGRHLARGLVELGGHASEHVEGEAQRLAHRVRLGREAARRVAFVGAGGAVEVGLRDQMSRRIVGVTPLPSLRVGDPGQAQLGVAVLVLGAYGRGVRNPTSRRVPPPHPPQRGPYWAALRHTVTSIVT
ncbi:hypothetical protein JCM13580A_42190 [Streptomyces drozdowiczii]